MICGNTQSSLMLFFATVVWCVNGATAQHDIDRDHRRMGTRPAFPLDRTMTISERAFPLTPMQQAMFVHSLAHQTDDLLLNQIVLSLRGPLDTELLADALKALVRRHPALRTALVWEGAQEPRQRVHSDAQVEVDIRDWRGRPVDALLLDWLKRDQVRGYNLRTAPLTRFGIFRVGEAAHDFVWSCHHLVADRWCIGVMLSDLFALYAERVTGVTADLPPVGAFSAYVEWARNQDYTALENYWRTQLAHHDHAAVSPTRMLASTARTGEDEVGESRLSAAHLGSIRKLLAPQRVTLATLYLGAWLLTLAAAAENDDVVTTLTASGRPDDLPDIDNTIGSFIVNVPFRTEIPVAGSFVEWLKTLQGAMLRQRAFEVVPPSLLIESADLRERPLAESIFLYQSPVVLPDVSGLGLSILPHAGLPATGLPLTVSAGMEDNTLGVSVQASLERFAPGAAQTLADAIGAVIQACLSDPTLTVRAARAAAAAYVASFAPTPRTRAVIDEQRVSAALPQPAANPFEARLVKLWAEILGHNRFGVTDHFFEIGGTTMKALQMLSALERQTRRVLPVSLLFAAPTIRSMAQLLADSPEALAGWKSLVPLQTDGPRTPLFMIHHGGGDVTSYALLSKAIGLTQPLYGLQQPGMHTGTSPHASVETLAAAYLAEVRALQPRGPYLIGGFCFGGLVAYEMAQQLTRAGETTALLVLIDAANPNPDAKPGNEVRQTRHREKLSALGPVQKAGYIAGRARRRVYWALRNRITAVERVAKTLAYRGYVAARRPAPLHLRQYNLLLANSRMNDAYHAEAYDGRVLLIRNNAEDFWPYLGWDRVVTGPLERVVMPSEDHLEMLREPHASVLAGHLRQHLDTTPA
jgi:thioesterase domain-containing protein